MALLEFVIHERLRADCHLLGKLSATHVLLHRNAALPWFILVPETQLDELLDLPQGLRDAVLVDCKRVADYLRRELGCAKVNVAWIGNLVPQLHVHVIGRRPGDACWPMPVWGHLEQVEAYSGERIGELVAGLIGPT